jgi:hypothetical protein
MVAAFAHVNSNAFEFCNGIYIYRCASLVVPNMFYYFLFARCVL